MRLKDSGTTDSTVEVELILSKGAGPDSVTMFCVGLPCTPLEPG